MQVWRTAMQSGLLPTMQKSSSSLSFAQSVYVGQYGHEQDRPFASLHLCASVQSISPDICVGFRDSFNYHHHPILVQFISQNFK